ncbi:ribonuclease H-like domain-containing protein [Hymenobacter sp. ASUV-10]|uniref:Ribonuclease H-like domain-containing protein n=1 Tax=Hymenobacter aranciens TaxID=3063996 RepID=A0ABT9BFR1_9BACT|nr:ribonuclease H-like domain-containing protein [Hymenobacter sp. ASUV-10]MDO7877109.1 ribonuclease H-like domain-containing protein [Hymenobacter sp. ASUV-10]
MNILRHVNLNRIFFVDIETVSGHATHGELSEVHSLLWEKFCSKRHSKELEAGQTHAELYPNAGLYAEFGKIVCISVGFFRYLPDNTLEFRTKSFADDDECVVLRGFRQFLDRYQPYGPARYAKLEAATPDGHFLCAHNGREFDYGYLGRRMLICGQSIPPMLDVAGFKPWELPHLLDTMDLWKFGDNKGFISLPLLAGVFNIPSPKDDIDGSQVGHTYWVEKDLARIKTYCEKDVLTTARVYLHFNGMQDLWPLVQHTSATAAVDSMMRVV